VRAGLNDVGSLLRVRVGSLLRVRVGSLLRVRVIRQDRATDSDKTIEGARQENTKDNRQDKTQIRRKMNHLRVTISIICFKYL
jgi:hypothetical protein